MTGAPDDDDDLLAAEYVLGVLDPPARAQTAARAKSDPAFADRVVAWESRLDGLNNGYAAVPAPDLLPRIEARLFPVAAPRPRGLMAGWFGWAGGAVAAVLIGVAVFVAWPALRPSEFDALPVVATLRAPDLAYEVRIDGARLQVIRVAGAAAPAGQVHELWIILPGQAPAPLGLLDAGTVTVAYPALPAGAVLAVSVEPAGGSTTGAPTGPVIMTAEVAA